MKEIRKNLSKKTLYLTILIKIGLTYFKLINKMLIILWILSLNNMDSILDTHAPFKKVNKHKLKFKTKPWITSDLQKSVSIKNNLLKKFITAKDPQFQERYHKEYKDYRNLLSTVLKQSKTNYNHYFESNWNGIKNTWKGIISMITIKDISADIPHTLSVDRLMVPPFPIQWQSQVFSTTIFLQLLVKRSSLFHFHINIFLIFLKIDLILHFL